MKKIILFLTICLFSLFSPNLVSALNPCEYIKTNVTVNLGKPEEKIFSLSNNLSDNPTVYYDKVLDSHFYKKDDGSYVKIDFNNSLKVDLIIDQAIASYLPGGSFDNDSYIKLWPKDVTCHTLELKPKNNTSSSYEYTAFGCRERVFFMGNSQGASSELQVKIPKDASQTICSNIAFNVKDKPIQQCKIAITDDNGGKFDTKSKISVSVTDVNTRCVSSYDYFVQWTCNMNRPSCSGVWTGGPYNQIIPGVGVQTGVNVIGGDCKNTTLQFKFKDLFAVSGASPYQLKVVSIISSGGAIGPDLCSASFSIVPEGATPTPPEYAGTNGQTTSSITVNNSVDICQTIPDSAQCGAKNCKQECLKCKSSEIWTGLGCLPTNVNALVQSIFTIFAGFIGAIILLRVIIVGFKVMLSQGNAEVLKKSSAEITSAVVGFLVLFFSFLILRIIGIDILKIPGWS